MPVFTMSDETTNTPADNGKARFTVFGVGGGGGNAVEHMVKSGISGVTFVCANTDRQALDSMSAPHLLQLGADTSRGLGAGANPEVGRAAAEADEEKIRQLLDGANMVFITAGMGGGTGTGAAPVVARIAKELNILTVAVVTTPFTFEGKRRIKAAQEGISELVKEVDSIITIPNDKLMSVYGNISMRDAFKKADDVLLNAVQGIAETITKPGMVNIDFEDIRTAMTARGHAMMGIGRATGDDRARQAAEMAIRSPLLDDVVLENAKGLLVNVIASDDVTLMEYNAVSEVVSQITDVDDGNIFYGSVLDETAGEELRVTVIATGLSRDESGERQKQAAANQTDLVQGAPTLNTPVETPAQHTSAFNRKQQGDSQLSQSARKPERSGASLDIHQYLRKQQNNKS